MSLYLGDYQNIAKAAVKKFWKTKGIAKNKQAKRGKLDQGERGSVTAGKNMDGFVNLVKEIVLKNGLPSANICLKRRVLTLPGFFRSTKQWDILVVNNHNLIAAIEFKSQVGSFGNNLNNRTEEAIGTAYDLWTAYREGAFGEYIKPFIGWMILVEDCEKSRKPVKCDSPHFPVFREFRDISYADRYNVLCKKLVTEQLYTSASVILSPQTASKTGEYSELSEMTGLKTFISSLAGHIATDASKSL